MQERSFINKWGITILAFIPLLLLVWLRLEYSSSFARSYDAVDFALGVEKFDLLEMRPHFPGYPFFILGGMFLHQWIDDPALALSLFNSIASVSSIIPMFLLFNKYLSYHRAILATLLGQSIPFINVIIVSPMSEGLAYSIVWWYMWSLLRALEGESWSKDMLPAVLFALLLGVRLSYLAVGVGLLILWFKRLKNKTYMYVAIHILLAILLQFVWVFALIQSVGGLNSFLYITVEFVKGHFTGWGGSVITSSSPWWQRLYQLIFHHILWVGFLGKSMWLILFWCIFFVSMVIKQRKRKIEILSLWGWLLGSYSVWVFFAQNIDKPRHVLPLLCLLAYLLFLYVAKRVNRTGLVVLYIILIGNLLVSFDYMKKQATELPATYQLASYVDNQLGANAMIYTWEEERVLDYLNVSGSYDKLYTYSLFLEDAKEKLSNGKEIYITNHVLEGFRLQGIEVTGLTKIAKFKSNDLFDPIYHDITLYSWKGD